MAPLTLIHDKTDVNALLTLVDALRGENGCPWDKKQTPRSMAAYMTEELYELLEAVEENRPEDVCTELGDLLFHICFITRLFQEQGDFDLHDVISATLSKMVHRHPHVFGEKKIDNADAVKDQWHQIKQKENNHADKTSVVDSVPVGTPALLRAYRISDRVARTGFDWRDISDVFKKVEEEITELKSAIADGKTDDDRCEKISLEFGDVLFALVNIARFAGIQPESALTASIRKFSRRFKQLEKVVAEAGKTIDSLSPEEMNRLWELAKGTVG
ncbi:nucleoside triphosphate pyrophosphohydrolase [Thermodesulfobacteriota bacterium]